MTIKRLPMNIQTLIPQCPPMQLVDTLIAAETLTASVTTIIKADNPFVDDEGILDPVIFLELMAQSIAALNGFEQLDTKSGAPEGLLLGAKNLKIFANAKIGDNLTVKVEKKAKFGDFGIVEGQIINNDQVIAFGEIKIWHKSGEV